MAIDFKKLAIAHNTAEEALDKLHHELIVIYLKIPELFTEHPAEFNLEYKLRLVRGLLEFSVTSKV